MVDGVPKKEICEDSNLTFPSNGNGELLIVPFRVRTATRKDIPTLEAFINQYWKPDANHSRELKNPNAIFLFAEKYNPIVPQEQIAIGTALMWVTDWNKTGYLAELAVSKEHQRKGYGSKIIGELAKRARKKGLRAIIVETQLENKVAMEFYLKKGFRMCGYNDRYYTNNPRSPHFIAIFFSLDL